MPTLGDKRMLYRDPITRCHASVADLTVLSIVGLGTHAHHAATHTVGVDHV